MILFSLDPGTNTSGYAIFRDGFLEKAGSVSVHHSKDRWQRTRIILSQLMDLGILEADKVASEEPVFRGHAAIAFNRFIGAIEYLRKDPLLYFKPTEVKASMGSGSLDKEEVAVSVTTLLKPHELLPILEKLNNHDMTDAIAVGLTALGRHAKPKEKQMPFKSKAQKGYLYANKPAVAKEFQAKTTKGAKLPSKVRKGKAKTKKAK